MIFNFGYLIKLVTNKTDSNLTYFLYLFIKTLAEGLIVFS